MKAQEIKKLSEKEHLLLRPAMYIGSVTNELHSMYIHEDNKFVKKDIKIVPGLIKILNELIDNAIDEHMRTGGKYANIISVTMTSNGFSVQDNGRGIPNKKVGDQYQAELAWCHARAGSNFDAQAAIGMNGIGSFATNVFSKEFLGISDDGETKLKLVTKDNFSSKKITLSKSTKQGTNVMTYPDFERFGITGFDKDHKKAIESRLYHLSVSYTSIGFKFNGKTIRTKKYFQMFSENIDVFQYQDYSIGIAHNNSDTFEHFSTVNGLLIPDGGTIVDTISGEITKRLREKLQRKYKDIKPAEIKNRLFLVVVANNFKDPKFNSQTKEKITNSEKEVKEYLNDIDYDKIFRKVIKNVELIDSITEFYKIKAEMKNRQELKKLAKKKKIKSDKYLPAIQRKKYLMLVEGDSALGGLSPALGRKEVGFYALKGKPLNAYSAPNSKFTSNKELSELFQIIKNENYEYIIYATDQDLDGIHIRGLLNGFFVKYLSEYIGKIGILNTPVKVAKKNKKIVRWEYDFNKDLDLKKGEVMAWKKGLGSWKKEELKEVVSKDTLSKMIVLLDFDDQEIIDDWLNDKKADKRKEYIQENDFDIVKV
jgi:DNA topoisomerase-2